MSERSPAGRAGLPPPAPRLRLAPGVAALATRLARGAGPEEACGLLLGRAGAEPLVRALLPAPNLAADRRRRFELDPAAVVAALDRARRGGLSLLGSWHSHPRGPLALSAADRAGAAAWGEGWLLLVSAPRGASLRWGLAGWRHEGAGDLRRLRVRPARAAAQRPRFQGPFACSSAWPALERPTAMP